MQWLTVHVSGREFGLEARRVRELAPCSWVTRVPGSARALRGLTGLRGQPIPVLDLALRLGRRHVAIGAHTPLVIVKAHVDGESVAVAFLVEGAGTLIDVDEPLRSRELEALAPGGVCTGFADLHDELVPLLDIDALAARDRLDEVPWEDAKPAAGTAQTSEEDARPRNDAKAWISPVRHSPVREQDSRGPSQSRAAPPPVAHHATKEHAGARGVGLRASYPSHGTPLPVKLAGPQPERTGMGLVRSTVAGGSFAGGQPDAAAREAWSHDAPADPTPQRPLGWFWPTVVLFLAIGLVILFALAAAGRQDDPAAVAESRRERVDVQEHQVPTVQRTDPIAARLEIVNEEGRKVSSGAPATKAAEAGSETKAQVKGKAPGTAPAPAEVRGRPCEIHEIRSGDTLWAIAGHYLRNPFRWPEVFARNRDLIVNPDRIEPHVRLRIEGACGGGTGPGEGPSSGRARR